MASRHRTPAEQGKHNELVRETRNILERADWAVVADHIGGPQPGRICWEHGECRIPDLAAVRDGVTLLVEVETASSVFGEDAKAQCKLFATWAKQHGQQFALVVPKGCEHAGREMMASLGFSEAQVAGL